VKNERRTYLRNHDYSLHDYLPWIISIFWFMYRRFGVASMKHEGPHKLDFACLGCVKKHIEHKNKLIDFLKREIKSREYVCATNHAVLLDNAQSLLDSIENDNET